MSSAGHVFEMINRIRQNMELKASRKKKYKNLKFHYVEQLAKYDETNNLGKQKITNAELEIIKQKIRNKLTKDRKRSIIYTIVVFAIVVFAFLYVAVY